MIQDRQDINGLKKACTFFQQSAGVFEFIRQDLIEGKKVLGPTTTDLSREGLEMMQSLMLAQAQACFYEKAIHDKHKPAILSKLASQAAEWYQTALRCAQALGDSLDKIWVSHLEFQYLCFSASSQLQFSKVVHATAEETTKGYGEEIARLQLSASWVDRAIQTAKSGKLPESMLSSVQHLRQVIERTLAEAIENNNKIYLEVIPAASFPSPPKASLAKPLKPSSEITEISDLSVKVEHEDSMFTGLLPVVMQEAEVIYASKVSKIVEDSASMVASSSEEVKMQLAEAGLPGAVEVSDGSAGMPDAVWQRINNSFLHRGGVGAIHKIIQDSERRAQSIAGILNDIESQLKNEEQQDNNCRVQFREKWTASPSAGLNLHMHGDITRYRGLLREANASDSMLQDKISKAAELLEILSYSKGKLDALFPSGADIDNSPQVENKRIELAMLLVKLGSNVAQCESIQAEMVDLSSSDSIMAAMIKAPGGPAAVSKSESATIAITEKEVAAKYTPMVNEIRKLIGQQSGLLHQVLEKNHDFARIRTQSENMVRREGVVAEINEALNSFEELLVFVNEGSKFYSNLGGRVDQLKQTATDHIYVRNLQRTELETQLNMYSPQQPAYPGMVVSPYAAGGNIAQAHPVNTVQGSIAPQYQAPPPQYQAPPPQYQAPPTQQPQAPPSYPVNSNLIQQMKDTLGSEFTDVQLSEALDGAGGNVNTAINHLLNNSTTPKKRSSKRFGLF